MHVIRKFIECESGVTSIEYGLIAALISLVILGSVTAIGTRLKAKFITIGNSIGT